MPEPTCAIKDCPETAIAAFNINIPPPEILWFDDEGFHGWAGTEPANFSLSICTDHFLLWTRTLCGNGHGITDLQANFTRA